MSIVIDLNLVCLVCLQEQQQDGVDAATAQDNEKHDFMRSVYDADEQTPQLVIMDKIARCSELRLQGEHDTKLPDKICTSCLGDLAATWRFRANCEQAAAVFASIQLQEEEADRQASRELEQQKIRLPSGLKIKRIQPETKTYLLPVHLEDEEELPVAIEVVSSELASVVVENRSRTEQLNESLQLDVLVETSEDNDDDGAEELVGEDDDFEDAEAEQHADFEDYYETEELLDEETKEHMEVVAAEKPKANADDDDVFDDDDKANTRIKLERLDEDKDENVEMQEEEERVKLVESIVAEQLPFRRARGRPRKDTKAEQETILLPKPMKIEKENLKDIAMLKIKHSALKKPFKKPQPPSQIRVKQPRKSSSPDPASSRPAKICEICGNSYKYQHALNAHMRRHTNTRPFNCEFCEKAFVSGVELRRHMRVHTGHKPYSCQFCERRFSDFGSRIKHERTHTGERPYKCGTCSKSFAYAHVLSVHVRTHTGEKKFQCTRCGKGFTKKIYLASHMQQHMRLSVKTELHDDFASMAAGTYHPQQQQQQQSTDGGEVMGMETVALEECIFTTNYIVGKSEHTDDEDDDEEDGDGETYEIAEVSDMTEEHLVDDGNELITGLR